MQSANDDEMRSAKDDNVDEAAQPPPSLKRGAGDRGSQAGSERE